MIGGEHCVRSDGSLLPSPESSHFLHRTERLDVYYNESAEGRYVPRAVLVDLDPKFLKEGPLSKQIPSKNIFYGRGGANNIFANGHYIDGADLVDGILDCVRKEVEACDGFQGFQMTHSLGGGTGSGLGTLVLSRLREEYPDRTMLNFCVSPYSCAGDSVVAPYNAVLALHQLVENSDQTVILDYKALLDMFGDTGEGSYHSMNSTVSYVMSGMTSCYRFPCPLNLDLRKVSVKMVPFPRLHMFMAAFAPNITENQKVSVSELAEQMYSPKHLLTSCDPRAGRYLATSTFFRGTEVTMREVDEHLLAVHKSDQSQLVKRAPFEVLTGLCSVPQENVDMSATYVHNSTAIKSSFNRLSEEFKILFKKKAFLAPFLSCGMDEMEFVEARSNLEDLIQEYKEYEIF